jgi:heat shock protein HtpX
VADGIPLNLFEQQEKNRRQTTLWMVAFVLFFAWLGFGGDFAAYVASLDADGVHRYHVPWIGIVVTVIGVLVTWRAFAKGPQRVLWASGAKEIVTPQTDQERQLRNVVEEMAIAASLPMPKVYIIDDPDPNAFATGHGPEDACIAATSGLIAALNREELQAVVGHEMGHVQNLDVRLMTTIAALVGFIVLLSDGLGRMMRGGLFNFGGGSRGSSRSSSKSSGGGAGAAIALVILVLWVISLILAPIIVRLMAMAVSRNREYLADATGAQFTRNPGALASALQKIDAAAEPTKSIKRSAAHLCIADPLGRSVNLKEGKLANLFGTHPPMAMRITRLKGMAFQSAKMAGELPA